VIFLGGNAFMQRCKFNFVLQIEQYVKGFLAAVNDRVSKNHKFWMGMVFKSLLFQPRSHRIACRLLFV